MKGYIYTMFKGADPGLGWHMTDPIFGRTPTMGACMPNIRRVVLPGDYIFVVSGSISGVQQYVVGGFKVDEKINALQAFKRFPENRLRRLPDGAIAGNIIMKSNGTKHELDYHSNFKERIHNYIVGRNPIVLTKPDQIDIARKESLYVLQDIFKEKGSRIGDVVARWRRMEESQIGSLVDWLRSVKARG